jgi:hypothetical protein
MGEPTTPSGAQPNETEATTIHSCILALENETDVSEIHSEMNIDYLVKLYKREYPGEAIWKLTQDIQRQAKIYSNIVEELKSLPFQTYQSMDNNISAALEAQAKFIKEKYEHLNLIQKGKMPNPIYDRVMDFAISKVAKYSKGLIKIANHFSYELSIELNIEVGVQVVFEVGVSLPPSFTIGIGGQVAKGGAIGGSIGTR